jgi:hypothetical protein
MYKRMLRWCPLAIHFVSANEHLSLVIGASKQL